MNIHDLDTVHLLFLPMRWAEERMAAQLIIEHHERHNWSVDRVDIPYTGEIIILATAPRQENMPLDEEGREP